MSITITSTSPANASAGLKKRYTLYTHSPNSQSIHTHLPCPQRVHLTIHELQIQHYFTFIPVDLANKPAELLTLTPNGAGAVPVLIDHGENTDGEKRFILTESRAVCRYLVAMHGCQSGMALPSVAVLRNKSSNDEDVRPSSSQSGMEKNIERMARFEEAACREAFSWDPVANRLAFELFFKEPMGSGPKKVQVAHDLERKVLKVCDGLEKVFEGDERLFMAGNEFSLVDIFYMPYMHHLVHLLSTKVIGGTITTRPRLLSWWSRVGERESYRRVFLQGVDGNIVA